jgi:pimeloyl-ACP methyl ester carboxylesterase
MVKHLFCYLLLVISLTSNAQTSAPKTVKGSIENSTYIIVFPSNWKNKLIMYAHGYEFMGTSTKQSDQADFITRMKPFLDRGFAVAASDYSGKGFVLPQAVDETEALRKHFIATYGKPDSTFMVGHSMGGGITVATIENFGEFYNGGLPLCPLSSRPYLQVRKEFDMYATFNTLFPGVVTSLHQIFDDYTKNTFTSFQNMMPKVLSIRKAIVEKDSLLGLAFANRFDLKFDDLPFSLFFGENVLKDIALKAKGNPFDNTNTLYSGFPDNWLVNEKVERLAATTDPNTLFSKYDRTGDIKKPMVLMHTIYDQLIPPIYSVVNIENMITQKGKSHLLTVKYTNGQGHCNFTDEQTGQAFDELRAWAKTGAKAKAGIIK